ncbi:MAG: 4Fe-4S dicluster domain-containing protein, partial [Lachnospiraceae bacterium]|nr:4Fe-4S dicluster domain-containing protein [Lachnospiraceae bacterium]
GTHLIIRKEKAGQQVRGLSWKEKRPRSSTPMRCSCSYGRGIPRIIMNEVFQVEDNLRTFRKEWPLSEEEREALMDIAETLKKGVPCTGCRYCCDGCPAGLDIPYLLQCYNDYAFAATMPPSMRIDALEEEKRPAACISCGQCAHACPQGIDVPSALKKLSEMYEKGPHWEEMVRIRQKAISRDLGEK